jgi:predicted O-linked N-acetylglucosamine transferase (SPINDLY family)
LDPPVDAETIRVERRLLPQGRRLIGTYGRLAKITHEYLCVLGTIATDNPDVAIVLSGTGDATRINEFIASEGLSDRFTVVDRYVDGHVWGHLIHVFLDTFPFQGGAECREMLAKGKPVVCMFSSEMPNFAAMRHPHLVARSTGEYAAIVSRLLQDEAYCHRVCQETEAFVRTIPSEADYAHQLDQAIEALRLATPVR